VKRGLTLLEVLVTLAVASASIAAVAHSTWSLLAARRASDRLQAATLIAERRMEALLARGDDALARQDSSEIVTDAAVPFTVRTVVGDGPRDNLWHVSVTVAPPGDGAGIGFHTLVRRRWSTL